MDTQNLGELASVMLRLDNARANRRNTALVRAENTIGIKRKSLSRHKLTGSTPCDCKACKAVLYRQARQSKQFMGPVRGTSTVSPARDLVVG